MAVCVIGGMITSTVLTLVVIPSVYLLSERRVARLSGVWRLFGGRAEAHANEDAHASQTSSGEPNE
jgi:HAE1 family hydrophobic/amphiphilic exporter-1